MPQTPHSAELAALLLTTALLAPACGLFGGGDDADKPAPPVANADQPNEDPKADGDAPKAPSKGKDKPDKAPALPSADGKNLARPSPSLKKTDEPPKPDPSRFVLPGAETPNDALAKAAPDDAAPPTDAPPTDAPPADKIAPEPAAVEALTPAKEPAGKDALDLNGALTSNLIKQSTGYSAALRPAPLQGIEPSADYNVAHMQPGSRQNFGVSIQVWREPNPGAQSRRFNDLLRQYPDAKRGRALGDSSFTASWEGLRYLIWLDRKKHYLAAVTCDSRICANDDKAAALARKLSERLPTY
jgi:hypothetical protein